MLVLTRHIGESIVIGVDIRITVVGIRGGRVRLGITAPSGLRVDRLEVHERREVPGVWTPPASNGQG